MLLPPLVLTIKVSYLSIAAKSSAKDQQPDDGPEGRDEAVGPPGGPVRTEASDGEGPGLEKAALSQQLQHGS